MKKNLFLLHLPFLIFISLAIIFKYFKLPMILDIILVLSTITYGFYYSRQIRKIGSD